MEMWEGRVGEMQAQLGRWAAKLDELVGKADQVGAEAKTDYRKRIADLRTRHRAAQAKLDELRTAGLHNWKTLRAGVESAWTALEAAFKKLTN